MPRRQANYAVAYSVNESGVEGMDEGDKFRITYLKALDTIM